jgi:rare lipoprotein A (peptidoglycan hydrolase)
LIGFSPHHLFELMKFFGMCRGKAMKTFVRFAFAVMLLITIGHNTHAATASIYGGRDGHCGHKTASGERLNCTAMTAAHRNLPFGTLVRVCHNGCVTVRVNDRGPWVRGRDIDLSPAAAGAIGLSSTGYVTLSVQR